MSLVYVQHRTICTHDEHEGVQYGSWSRHNDFTVDGVTLDTKMRWGYDAVQIAPAVVVGDTVWVLYVTYGTGDSFGHSSGQGEVVWVFTEEAVATKALEDLEKLGTARDVVAFRFVDEDGEQLHVCNPANDYFSNLEGFHLQSYIVGQCPDSRY